MVPPWCSAKIRPSFGVEPATGWQTRLSFLSLIPARRRAPPARYRRGDGMLRNLGWNGVRLKDLAHASASGTQAKRLGSLLDARAEEAGDRPGCAGDRRRYDHDRDYSVPDPPPGNSCSKMTVESIPQAAAIPAPVGKSEYSPRYNQRENHGCAIVPPEVRQAHSHIALSFIYPAL